MKMLHWCMKIAVIALVNATGEISRQKCQEYSKYVYVDEDSPVLSAAAAADQSNKVSKCGIVETPLIVGGQRVNENEFPHMAALGYRSDDFNSTFSWKCGGSVISPTFILTAAHCENDRESGNPIVVKMGVIHIHDNGPNAQIINVASITSHPQYKSSEKYNDVALIKLESSIRFDEHVRPACLATGSKSQSNKMIAIGFGKIQYEDDNGSQHLSKVLLSYVDMETCKRTYQTYKPLKNGIIDSQFCCGEIEGGKVLRMNAYCYAFHYELKHFFFQPGYLPGGPLQVVMTEPYCMYEIVGITSFGKFCGFASSFGVYTNVSSYLDFIEKIVWP